MSLSRVIVVALAAFRVAMLIAVEEGPFEIFIRLRAKAGAYEYRQDGRPESGLGRGISCPLCIGVYASVLLVLLERTAYGRLAVDGLGIAGCQVLFQRLAEGLSDGSNE